MAATSETLDIVKIGLEILSVVSTVAVGYIAVTIKGLVASFKLALANNKSEIMDHIQKTKDVLQVDSRTAVENSHKIDVVLASHIVQDNERFTAMGKTLETQDVTLGRIENKIDRNYDTRTGSARKADRNDG